MLDLFKVPGKDQVLVTEAALRRTVSQILEKLGVAEEDAADAADVLTMTDLRGVETHGVSNMLRAYVRDYQAGKLDPRPGWTIERESPGTAVILALTMASRSVSRDSMGRSVRASCEVMSVWTEVSPARSARNRTMMARRSSGRDGSPSHRLMRSTTPAAQPSRREMTSKTVRWRSGSVVRSNGRTASCSRTIPGVVSIATRTALETRGE